MKSNEIGHFPYQPPRNQYDNGGHPRQLLTWENGNVKWLPNWKILGEVDVVNIPHEPPFKNDEPLIDLQTAHDCYCANELEVNGKKYIHLFGSGWADEGFPFYDDSFNPKDPYETGRGCYALLQGKARNKFFKLAQQDCIPTFNNCSTGNIKKDFILPKD